MLPFIFQDPSVCVAVGPSLDIQTLAHFCCRNVPRKGVAMIFQRAKVLNWWMLPVRNFAVNQKSPCGPWDPRVPAFPRAGGICESHPVHLVGSQSHIATTG